MKKGILQIIVLTLGMCLLAGTGWAQEKVLKPSGFLQDYSKLTSDDPMKKVDWVYIKEDTNWKQYKKLMLDDVVFFAAQNADFKGMEAQEMADLGKAFHQAFITNMVGAVEFADKPGPDVMRMRLAITNLKPNNTVTGTVTTIVPVGLAISTIKYAVTGSHIGIGSISVEAELVDSQSVEVLAALVDEEMGKKYKVVKGMSKSAQLFDIFNKWGQTFRARWDKRIGN